MDECSETSYLSTRCWDNIKLQWITSWARATKRKSDTRRCRLANKVKANFLIRFTKKLKITLEAM
ncbi:hypothetical protein FXE34_00290 [Vibrio cholerae]|uniref:Uncharacterized protein n=1 Tax=Vibrio paracholerae TaxID=650003 RepID=A0ABD7G0G5_9VIBR|nr:hypothetical protein DLR72_00910 [Vibrio paracholerae]TXX52056.1 hypothetical protein FXF14_02275 [Vibrio cholerae]TYA09769.1 hypothetical protein FXE34_00290 [Vibrio cholerae]